MHCIRTFYLLELKKEQVLADDSNRRSNCNNGDKTTLLSPLIQ